MTKRIKSIISKVLVAILIVSMMPVFSFAGIKSNSKKCVFLGDSMSQGYMFNDYVDGDCGWQGASSKSSIKLFQKYLRKKGVLKPCEEIVDLSMQGMMPDNIWAMINEYQANDKPFANEGIELKIDLEEAEELHLSFDAVRYLDWQQDAIKNRGRWDVPKEYSGLQDFDLLNTVFVDNIMDADILVYDLGMGNFGIYIVDRIKHILEGETNSKYKVFKWENLASLMDCLSPEQKQSLRDARTNITNLIKGTGVLPQDTIGTVDKVIDTLLYGYASYIYYNDKVIDWIYKNNKNKKNLQLIVSGLYNPLPESNIVIPVNDEKNIKLDVAKILNCILESASLYTSSVSKYADTYAFANMMNEKKPIESFVGEFRRCNDVSELTVDAICNGFSVLDPDLDKSIHTNPLRDGAIALKEGREITEEILEQINPEDLIPLVCEDFIDIFASCCCEAMNNTEFALEDLSAALGGGTETIASRVNSLVNKLTVSRETIDPDEYKAEYKALSLALMFSGARSFGCHPSPLGQYNKFLSLKEAYIDSCRGVPSKIKNVGNISKYVRKTGNQIYDFVAENGAVGMNVVVQLAQSNGLITNKEDAEKINQMVDKLIGLMNDGNIKKAKDLCNQIAECYENCAKISIQVLWSNPLVRKIITMKKAA